MGPPAHPQGQSPGGGAERPALRRPTDRPGRRRGRCLPGPRALVPQLAAVPHPVLRRPRHALHVPRPRCRHPRHRPANPGRRVPQPRRGMGHHAVSRPRAEPQVRDRRIVVPDRHGGARRVHDRLAAAQAHAARLLRELLQQGAAGWHRVRPADHPRHDPPPRPLHAVHAATRAGQGRAGRADRRRRAGAVGGRMATLEFNGVQKRFGSTTALAELDLELKAGELVTLLGPSGCGKTTALRIAAGFEVPDTGSVIVDGIDMSRTPPNKRKMGMVFQSYSLFPNLNAAGNVAFGLRNAGVGKADRDKRVTEMLELVQLTDFANRYPHQLSGGQQQRVALAQGAGHLAAGAAPRRAALGPRRQGASAPARRDPSHPDRAGDHHALRHPRPGGGARHLRPDRGHVGRAPRAARLPDRRLPVAVERVRRPLRRHDERAAGHRARARPRGRCGRDHPDADGERFRRRGEGHAAGAAGGRLDRPGRTALR